MSAPPSKTVRVFDFNNFSENYPTAQQPGLQIDAELNAAKATSDAIIDRLAEIQRSDGKLANSIVTLDAIAPQVMTMIGGWNPTGAWVTAKSYSVKDTVVQGGQNYICLIAHVSGVFATDLGLGRWGLISQVSIAVDGSSPPVADISWGGHKIINLAAGTAGTDAVNKAQMDAALAAVSATIPAAPSQADETTAGIGEIATDPEMIAGTAGKLADAAKVKTYVAAQIAALPATPLPQNYFTGFTLGNNALDPTHDIDVAPGKARNDADTFNLISAATIVKQTDVAFAEYALPGTASGGMDSTTPLGAGAATVHVFMIGGAGKNTQPFFSTSINPPLPAGFTAKEYVNSVLWTGATIRPFVQRGRDEIELKTPVQQSATNPGVAAQTITLTIPTGVELMAHVGLLVITTTVTAYTGLSALDTTDLDPNVAGNAALFAVHSRSLTNDGHASSGWVKANASGQIRARASASGAANVQYIGSLGWRVMRP